MTELSTAQENGNRTKEVEVHCGGSGGIVGSY
jgi:hypothetical protein